MSSASTVLPEPSARVLELSSSVGDGGDDGGGGEGTVPRRSNVLPRVLDRASPLPMPTPSPRPEMPPPCAAGAPESEWLAPRGRVVVYTARPGSSQIAQGWFK